MVRLRSVQVNARAATLAVRDIRCWLYQSRPSHLPATSARGRIPAVRVVDVRFPGGFGGSTLSSRHGG
jgi:hypothetical protein